MHEIQKKILEYAKSEQLSGKTLRDVGFVIGEEHPQKIKHHIEQLLKKGLLQKTNDGNYYVVQKDEGNSEFLRSIPILGLANCGPATTIAEECFEGFVRVSNSVLPKGHELFIVEAEGKSLNKASISGQSVNDGDYLVVDKDNKDINNGDYVLSVIEGYGNVKKFYYDEGSKLINLVSESTEEFHPIVINPEEMNYFINGKIIKVIKNPKNYKRLD